MRTRAERRHNDLIKALRKRSITRNVYHINKADEENPYQTFNIIRRVRGDDKYGYYGNLHQYSKNKIHCSDGYYLKTNNRGRKKYYGQGCKLWKASDLRKIVRLEEEYGLYI